MELLCCRSGKRLLLSRGGGKTTKARVSFSRITKPTSIAKHVRTLFKHTISSEQLDASTNLIKFGTPSEIGNTLILAIKLRRSDAFMAILTGLTPYKSKFKSDPNEAEILLSVLSHLLKDPKLLKGKLLKYALLPIARYLQARHYYSGKSITSKLDNVTKKLLTIIGRLKGHKSRGAKNQANLLMKFLSSNTEGLKKAMANFQRSYAKKLGSKGNVTAYFNTLITLLCMSPSNHAKGNRSYDLLKKTMLMKRMPALMYTNELVACARYSAFSSIRAYLLNLMPYVLSGNEAYRALRRNLLIERTAARIHAANVFAAFAKTKGKKFADQIASTFIHALFSKNRAEEHGIASAYGRAVAAGILPFPHRGIIAALRHPKATIKFRAIRILGWLNVHTKPAGIMLKKLIRNNDELTAQAAVIAFSYKHRKAAIYNPTGTTDSSNSFTFPVFPAPFAHRSGLDYLDIRSDAPAAWKDPNIRKAFPSKRIKENSERFELLYLAGYYNTAILELQRNYMVHKDPIIAKAIRLYKRRLAAIKPLYQQLPQIVGKNTVRVYGSNIMVKISKTVTIPNGRVPNSMLLAIGLGVISGDPDNVIPILWPTDGRTPLTFILKTLSDPKSHAEFKKNWEIRIKPKYPFKRYPFAHRVRFMIHEIGHAVDRYKTYESLLSETCKGKVNTSYCYTPAEALKKSWNFSRNDVDGDFENRCRAAGVLPNAIWRNYWRDYDSKKIRTSEFMKRWGRTHKRVRSLFPRPYAAKTAHEYYAVGRTSYLLGDTWSKLFRMWTRKDLRTKAPILYKIFNAWNDPLRFNR